VPEELKPQKQSLIERIVKGKKKSKVLKESKVKIFKEYSIPSYDSFTLDKISKEIGTEIKPIDAYNEGLHKALYNEGESETTSNHHLLGNYTGIQNEFHELNFSKIAIKDIHDISLDELKELLKWRLLFQFDSDDNLDFCWGDWGRIIFFYT